jgi:hypothetical protein
MVLYLITRFVHVWFLLDTRNRILSVRNFQLLLDLIQLNRFAVTSCSSLIYLTNNTSLQQLTLIFSGSSNSRIT